MKALCLSGAIGLAAFAASAQERAPLPDFQTCKDAEIARFERDLARSRAGNFKEMWLYLNTGDLDVCGTIGIILCDRGDAPIACQHALAAEQDMLTQQVLASLPAPDTASEDEPSETEALYERVWRLAQGTSAGPDCAGMPEVMEAWCQAREATLRLTIAVLAYQVAREADRIAPATALGWAREVPQMRPQARKAKGE